MSIVASSDKCVNELPVCKIFVENNVEEKDDVSVDLDRRGNVSS